MSTIKINGKLNIPEGIIELPLKPVLIRNAKKVLFISDTHIPFHDKKAIETALNYGKDADTIILGGDVMDIYQGSYFSKDPSIAKLKDEIEICIKFLDYLREKFPSAQIIYYEGNHEIRLKRYVNDKAPLLYGIESVLLESLLQLKLKGIQYVENGVGLKVGGLTMIHGNETGCRGGVNIANTMVNKTYTNCLFGNFHKTQQTLRTDLNGVMFANWSVGCLCGLNPRYLPKGNQWNWGFAKIEIYGKEFEVQNKIILDNYNVR